MKEKLSNRLAAAILRDFRLENIEWSKCQVMFVTEDEVISKPFLSCLKKLPQYFTHQLYMYLFLSEDSPFGF